MKKIILVYPRTGKYDSLLTDIPLSLLCTATLVCKEYKVVIIDQRVDEDWKQKLKKELLDGQVICLGLTSMTGKQIKYALEIIRFVKNIKDIPIVFGGIHASLMPKQTIQNEYIDFVIVGEGESTFFNLVKALDLKKNVEDVKGIWLKKNKELIFTGEEKFIDLNKLPELPYHLISLDKYKRKGFDKKIISVITSRGCPHQCTFCYSTVFHKRVWRQKKAEIAIKEIKGLINKYKPDEIFFVDDNFFVDLERSKKIIKGIIQDNKTKLSFRGLRVDEVERMDNEFLELLEKSGVNNLCIGAESGSERILKLMKKGITPKQTININRKLRRYDLSPVYNFMFGIPSERLSDIKDTTRLVLKLLKENKKATINVIGTFIPYPGAELYETSKEYGFKEPKKLEDWANFDYENWLKNNPWINKKTKKLIRMLSLASFFIDNKIKENIVSKNIFSKLIRLSAKLYKPVALSRFKTHITIFPLEFLAEKLFFRYFE